MKKIIKYLMKLSLCLCFALSLFCFPVDATSIENARITHDEIDKCFNNSAVIYNNNNDVTSQFINDNLTSYKNKDYDTIEKILLADNFTLIILDSGITETSSGKRLIERTASNFITFVDSYNGYVSKVKYYANVTFNDGYGDCLSYTGVKTSIIQNQYLKRAGVRNGATSRVINGNPDSVEHIFSIWIERKDGTMIDDPNVKIKLIVKCTTGKQPGATTI